MKQNKAQQVIAASHDVLGRWLACRKLNADHAQA